MSALRSLADLVARRIGIATEDRRLANLAARIEPVLAARGFASMEELVMRLEASTDPGLLNTIIEAVVINETLFFRDRGPFEKFRTVMLDRLLATRQNSRRLRLWSAACSTGQEPYSLAILLDEEMRRLGGWQLDIVATDISRSALRIAKAGVYSHFEVQRGLSTPHLLRYFRKQDSNWVISDHLRAHVSFAERNLLGDFRALGTFDVIFCRNVLMYMDLACRRGILERMWQSLSPDGFLVMGAAETIVGISDQFMPLPGHPAIYVKRGVEGRPPLQLLADARS